MDTATLDLQVTKVTWKVTHRGSGRGQARGGRPGRYLVPPQGWVPDHALGQVQGRVPEEREARERAMEHATEPYGQR